MNYVDYSFYEDVINTGLIISSKFRMEERVAALVSACVEIALCRLEKINKFNHEKFKLIFDKNDLYKYVETKLVSVIINYAFNEYVDREKVIFKNKTYISINDTKKILEYNNLENAIDWLFKNSIYTIVKLSKEFGKSYELMGGENTDTLYDHSRKFSFKDTCIYDNDMRGWDEIIKRKKISINEYAYQTLRRKMFLVQESKLPPVFLELREYYFEVANNLELLSYISNKAREYDILENYELIEALVLTTHIDEINLRKKCVDYFIDSYNKGLFNLQDAVDEISYICDYALPFIVDYSFNILRMVGSKEEIFTAIGNEIYKDRKIMPTNVFQIQLELNILKKYKIRQIFKPYYYLNLRHCVNELIYCDKTISLSVVVNKVVEEWFKISKFDILLEKIQVIRYFEKQIVLNYIIENDNKISLNKASKEFVGKIKTKKFKDIELKNLDRRYRDYFNDHFKKDCRIINSSQYNFKKNPKEYQKYQIPKIIVELQDIVFLVKETKIAKEKIDANNLSELKKNTKKIEDTIYRFFTNSMNSIREEIISDEIERLYDIDLTNYIYSEYSNYIEQIPNELLSLYRIPEVRSRKKYADYYFEKCIYSQEDKARLLESIQALDQTTFDKVVRSINIVLNNLGVGMRESLIKKAYIDIIGE